MYYSKLALSFLLLFGSTFFVGCSSELPSSVSLNLASDSRQARLESELSVLNQERIRVEAERARHDTAVTAYLMNHKMATAAIVAGVGGTGVALDSSNEFSEEAEQIGAGMATMAAIYAIANFEEVAEVTNEMANASVIQEQYLQRLKQLDVQIAERQEKLQ